MQHNRRSALAVHCTWHWQWGFPQRSISVSVCQHCGAKAWSFATRSVWAAAHSMCGAVPHQFSAYTFPLLEQRLRRVLCGRKLLWQIRIMMGKVVEKLNRLFCLLIICVF